MTKGITISPKASQDLDKCFAYIAENNLDAALRFFDATRQTFSRLAQMPEIGRLYSSQNPRFAGLRRLSVKGFDNYIIFYLPLDNYIEIVRILHASRDLEDIFLADEAE